MMKRPFVGAFWLTVVTGALFGAYFLFRVTRLSYNPGFLILYPLVFLGVIFGEAAFYWRVRWRNVYRRESWMHAGFLAIALLGLPVLRNLLVALLFVGYDRFEYRLWMRNIDLTYMCLYWCMTLVAHGFFVKVMIRCLRRPVSVAADPGGGQENLLDDVEE
jgi:hypothetical protein